MRDSENRKRSKNVTARNAMLLLLALTSSVRGSQAQVPAGQEEVIPQLPQAESGNPLSGSPSVSTPSDTTSVMPERDRVGDCAQALLEEAKYTGRDITGTFRKSSVRKDEEFLEYMLSVIYVESRFDSTAISPAEARGLMQMTGIAVREAVSKCSLKPVQDPDKMHINELNIKYGSCYLAHLHDEMDGNWTRTLITYNGGYRQLIRYDRGLQIAQETANYVLQVNRILDTVCRRVPNTSIERIAK